MQTRSLAILLWLLIFSTLLLINADRVSAQSSLVTTARTDITNAYQSIRTAEQEGALNIDLLPLVNQLNRALQLEENATLLQQKNDTKDANNLALQSINLSTNVSSEAQQLANQAQDATQHRTIYAYTIALTIAAILAVFVVAAPEVGKLVQSKRSRKARIIIEDEDHEK